MSHQLLAGKRVRAHGRAKHRQRRADQRTGNGNKDGMLERGTAQNFLIAVQGENAGPEVQTAANGILRIVDGNDEDVPEGVDRNHSNQRKEHNFEDIQNPFAYGSFAVNAIGNGGLYRNS